MKPLLVQWLTLTLVLATLTVFALSLASWHRAALKLEAISLALVRDQAHLARPEPEAPEPSPLPWSGSDLSYPRVRSLVEDLTRLLEETGIEGAGLRMIEDDIHDAFPGPGVEVSFETEVPLLIAFLSGWAKTAVGTGLEQMNLAVGESQRLTVSLTIRKL